MKRLLAAAALAVVSFAAAAAAAPANVAATAGNLGAPPVHVIDVAQRPGGGFAGGGGRGFAGGGGAPRGIIGGGGGRGFAGGGIGPKYGIVRGGSVGPNPAFRHKPHGGNWGYKHRRHRGIYVAPLIGYGAYRSYNYYYDDDCAWLYRKWQNTGSKYWWRRYKECAY